jgi:DNA-binding response OmpR family regulator
VTTANPAAVSPRVLVVEDDAALCGTLVAYLGRQRLAAVPAASGAQALERAAAGDIDAVVLDLMLPDMDGRQVCRELRQLTAAPVLILTARSDRRDKLSGFAAGADDYVVKPFDPPELVARLRALLRRAGRDPAGVLQVGPLTLDRSHRTVDVDGRRAFLTPREFDLLETLAAMPGRPFSRSQIVSRAWGMDADTEDRTVDTTVVRVRRKLQDLGVSPDRVSIATLWGVGYRLDLWGR